MGCHSLDIELQAFVADGLEYVRSHPETIDEIFGKWDESHIARRLSNQNGDKPTVIIKRWLADNNIPVVMGFGLQQQKMPCVSIHLAGSTENIGHAHLADHGGFDSEPATVESLIIVEKFVPKGYNSKSGRIDVNLKTTSIEKVYVGAILVDAKNEEYLIDYVDSDAGIFTILVEGNAVDKRSMYIKSPNGTVLKKAGVAHFNDIVDVSVHAAEEPQVVLWIYYICSWLFFRFKPILEARGVQIHTFSGSDYDRAQRETPAEIIFSRHLRFSASTTIEWHEEKIQPGQVEFEVKTK